MGALGLPPNAQPPLNPCCHCVDQCGTCPSLCMWRLQVEGIKVEDDLEAALAAQEEARAAAAAKAELDAREQAKRAKKAAAEGEALLATCCMMGGLMWALAEERCGGGWMRACTALRYSAPAAVHKSCFMWWATLLCLFTRCLNTLTPTCCAAAPHPALAALKSMATREQRVAKVRGEKDPMHHCNAPAPSRAHGVEAVG